MTPEAATAMYRRRLAPFEIIQIRRYTGSGTARPRFDWDVAARDLGTVEGVRSLIVLHDDLVLAGFPFPIEDGPNWKVVVRGKELQIKAIDGNTRRLGDVTIAYEIKVGG